MSLGLGQIDETFLPGYLEAYADFDADADCSDSEPVDSDVNIDAKS